VTQSDETTFALIKKDIQEIYKDISHFITRREFESEIEKLSARLSPVEKIVYGFTGMLLVAVIGALVRLVIKE
jgi:hypothetical protein